MKRIGNLLEAIADTENIELAYWKAQRGKKYKNIVCRNRPCLWKELADLRQQILSSDVKVGNYHFFKIYDPKERVVCSADFLEHVLHHALINVCSPYFERHFIHDTYACRKGKGPFKALERAKTYQRKYRFFLKLDVRKYFDTVDHVILKEKLERIFKDKLLLKVFFRIIDSYHVTDGDGNKGLPLGNLTSQYFANFYLSFADHYAKEVLHTTAYVRYMDDIVIWSNRKDELIAKGEELKRFLKESLFLELKQFYLNSNDNGLPFLGYLLYRNKVKLQQKRKKRFIRKFNECIYYFRIGRWTQEDLALHLRPIFAYADYAETIGLRERILLKLNK